MIVGKGSQGIRFYQRWISEHWGVPVEVLARGGGYRVLEAHRPGHVPDTSREAERDPPTPTGSGSGEPVPRSA